MKIVDMHCDTISRLLGLQRQRQDISLRTNTGHADLLRMRDSGYLLQNFALFVNCGSGCDPWEEVCSLYSLFEKEVERNADVVARVRQFSDIEANAAQGKVSAMLTVEEGAVCKGEIAKLEQLYQMGVRMITLTWNYPNGIGYPNLDCSRDPSADFLYVPDTERGLTTKGREMVEAMETLGIIVDVSHLSDAGFYDVLECTRKPFVASHSNVRSVCRCVRNLTDDMLRKLAERGGCTGLNFCPDFLKEVPEGIPNPGTIDAVVAHARYIVNLAGVDVLGLGSDFDGIDGHAQLQGVQNMELLWEALHRSGFTQSQLDKIFCENVLRVYRDVLA